MACLLETQEIICFWNDRSAKVRYVTIRSTSEGGKSDVYPSLSFAQTVALVSQNALVLVADTNFSFKLPTACISIRNEAISTRPCVQVCSV